MAHTRRTQLLMEPDEYAELERIAEQKRVSVAELIRTAVRVVYLRSPDDKLATVGHIAAMNLPVDSWSQMNGLVVPDEGGDRGGLRWRSSLTQTSSSTPRVATAC